jgi:hypothetical protein
MSETAIVVQRIGSQVGVLGALVIPNTTDFMHRREHFDKRPCRGADNLTAQRASGYRLLASENWLEGSLMSFQCERVHGFLIRRGMQESLTKA